jgi:hypothetical protein
MPIAATLKGSFTTVAQNMDERPFQGRIALSNVFPGLRPGLMESALQAAFGLG